MAMNLRQSITRNITYSKVAISTKEEAKAYYVHGDTTVAKEMKKYLKENPNVTEIPTITVFGFTEKRAISLDNFLNYSELITETDENVSRETCDKEEVKEEGAQNE